MGRLLGLASGLASLEKVLRPHIGSSFDAGLHNPSSEPPRPDARERLGWLDGGEVMPAIEVDGEGVFDSGFRGSGLFASAVRYACCSVTSLHMTGAEETNAPRDSLPIRFYASRKMTWSTTGTDAESGGQSGSNFRMRGTGAAAGRSERGKSMSNSRRGMPN